MRKKPSERITAIVIDDDYDLAQVVSEYLQMHGIRVLKIGHNGKDAYDLYKKCSPDLIITDLIMPEFDGYYGVSKIKGIDPDAKIIVITSDTDPTVSRRLSLLGVDGIVYKPINMSRLLSLTCRLCQRGLTKIER